MRIFADKNKPIIYLLNSKMKKILFLFLCVLASVGAGAKGINREAVVKRHNPTNTRMDTLGALTVGNGAFAFTVDATGLQTFPELYSRGIPLGTMSDWGWHSFPNKAGFRPEEALVNHDFHRHAQELYAAQFRVAGRQKDASNYFRVNPHRLHLGTLGLNLADAARVKDVRQTLDMWNGLVDSKFNYDGKAYHVRTLCYPDRDKVAGHIQSDGPIALRLRIPYPTGGHADDACDWSKGYLVRTTLAETGTNYFKLKVEIDSTTFFIRFDWTGVVKLKAVGSNEIDITTQAHDFTFACEWTPENTAEAAGDNADATWKGYAWMQFPKMEKAVAEWWHDYWKRGGMIDFGATTDPRAHELERRIVQSLYLLAVNDAGDYPPAETGLTYNSWFGKFHLEMIYWHQTYQALWGHPEVLEHTLDWYFKAEPMAREIARRQGFKGVRWMKMTDPSAAEAPSNVGSYLIWQQPHLIYLAELVYRAALADKKEGKAKADAVLHKFAPLVQATADFMYDFAERDAATGLYVLRGYIPAQETLSADSVRNSPFELSYWLTTMKMAQDWRVRQGLPRDAQWDELIERLSPLPSKNGVYLTAEGTPLIDHVAEQTDDPTGIDKFASDHPMPLGALGMMPQSRLFTAENMSKTYDWTLTHWNWQKTWGWDYPMTAMCATRLGRASDAVDALLMPVPKNTYLPQGHNWQTNRLRLYLPGNGGLLIATALMAAGWDGCDKACPGYPADWNVKVEGLLPLP